MQAIWRKSSYSNQQGGDCVEVGRTRSAVLVRDTRHRAQGHLRFSPAEFCAFLGAVRAGRL
jgi:hypothetical protein